MSEQFVAISGPPEFITKLKSLEIPYIEVGRPTITESLNDALDAPINPDDIRQIFESVDVIIKSGIDFLTLATLLISAIKTTDTPSATIRDAETNKVIVTMDPNTQPDSLASKLKTTLHKGTPP